MMARSIDSKTVIIAVDHRWRDLPGHAYLAELLEKKYHLKAILVRNYDEVKYWKAFEPNCIIINHLLEDHRRKWANELPKEVKLVILPTEGLSGVLADTSSLILGGTRNEYARIDALLSWIKDVDRFWSDDLALKRSAVLETGIPRFDFMYDATIRRAFIPEARMRHSIGIPNGKKVVSFFLNFQYATVARDIERWERILITQGLNPEPYLLMVKQDVMARKAFCDVLKECVSRYPDLFFIIKPHPNEDFTFYSDFEIKGRVRLVPNAYSLEVLQISDMNIQRICTTGLESAIMRKLSIDFNYGIEGAYKGDVLKGIWPEAASCEELFQLLEQWRNNDLTAWHRSKGRREQVIHEWASLRPGKATEAAAEFICALCKDARPYKISYFERGIAKVRYYTISLLKDIYRKIVPDAWGRYNKAPTFWDLYSWRRKIAKTLKQA
jgi:surface carbohydrate biosynthesis protein